MDMTGGTITTVYSEASEADDCAWRKNVLFSGQCIKALGAGIPMRIRFGWLWTGPEEG